MTRSEIKELIEILKKEGCNSKKQAIEYLEGKLNMKEKERNEKEELMNLCRDENDIRDCGMCEYEFTDTCSLRLEKIKNEIEKIIERRKKNKLMDHCRFVYHVHDCCLCDYKFTDTCDLRLKEIRKNLKEIINERYGFKKSS